MADTDKLDNKPLDKLTGPERAAMAAGNREKATVTKPEAEQRQRSAEVKQAQGAGGGGGLPETQDHSQPDRFALEHGEQEETGDDDSDVPVQKRPENQWSADKK